LQADPPNDHPTRQTCEQWVAIRTPMSCKRWMQETNSRPRRDSNISGWGEKALGNLDNPRNIRSTNFSPTEN
jgi:hypothetical protein